MAPELEVGITRMHGVEFLGMTKHNFRLGAEFGICAPMLFRCCETERL